LDNAQENIQRHLAFWNREKVDRPLVGFQIGTYFFADRFESARRLMIPGRELHPTDIVVEEFLPDYERLYQQIERLEQDAFWTACPFTSIPWMEGILGCKIKALESSFTSIPYLPDVHNTKVLPGIEENAWLEKFVEFTEKLVQMARGRFPTGQPIMRGPSDMMGALRGQRDFVLDFYDHPEETRALLNTVTERFLQVMEQYHAELKAFKGGYSMGVFDLWAPDRCIWAQEDLSTLLNPNIYSQYLAKLDETICAKYPYNAFHIHASSFFILDDLLQIESIMAIELTKDIGGTSIEKMVPQFRKILRDKRLIIWGDLDFEDIDIILRKLPYEGLYLHIVTESTTRAAELMDYIKSEAHSA
jgi:hypothetical protein